MPEVELVPWLVNFTAKFPNYSLTLGFTPAELAQTLKETNYLVYLLNVLVPVLRQTLAATVEYKNLIKEGDASSTLPITLPGTTLPPGAPGPPPPPGVMPRLRRLVQNIKSRPAYTDTIGQDLGIVSGSASAGPEAPTLTLLSSTAGAVTLGWNKGGWTGVKVQGRTGAGGGWTDLGVDLFSPYVDTRPLSAPGQPETREYRACYLDGDDAQPTWSQALTLTVAP